MTLKLIFAMSIMIISKSASSNAEENSKASVSSFISNLIIEENRENTAIHDVAILNGRNSCGNCFDQIEEILKKISWENPILLSTNSTTYYEENQRKFSFAIIILDTLNTVNKKKLKKKTNLKKIKKILKLRHKFSQKLFKISEHSKPLPKVKWL